MISSVIVKLALDSKTRHEAIEKIVAKPGLETGELIDTVMLPVTIEAVNAEEMNQTTHWLQGLDGVEFVDVVYVHFEE